MPTETDGFHARDIGTRRSLGESRTTARRTAGVGGSRVASHLRGLDSDAPRSSLGGLCALGAPRLPSGASETGRRSRYIRPPPESGSGTNLYAVTPGRPKYPRGQPNKKTRSRHSSPARSPPATPLEIAVHHHQTQLLPGPPDWQPDGTGRAADPPRPAGREVNGCPSTSQTGPYMLTSARYGPAALGPNPWPQLRPKGGELAAEDHPFRLGRRLA